MAELTWKTKEEIEAEKNKPKPKTEIELLREENEMLAMAVMELSSHVLKGGKQMLAMLFATYVIRGKWSYADVPDLLKSEVDKILIAEGREDLTNAEQALFFMSKTNI